MTEYTKKDTILNVSNINKSFDGKQVLRNVNLLVKDIVRPGITQGQVISLVGRSGSGKSTLFSLLAGLTKPDSGQILVNGNQKPVKTGEMGVVFQDYYIYYWRKVNKILQLAIEKNTSIKPEQRKEAIANIADQFDLTDHLLKWPCQLSGGQKQRVAIAEQILNGSNFMLLDEPFSGLDALMIDKTLSLLTKVSLSDELKTLIIVSHDLSNSIAISDTVFILGKEGENTGSTIKHEIDLIERDLAWHIDIKNDPRFRETINEVKSYL